jgi:hypothetical protein
MVDKLVTVEDKDAVFSTMYNTKDSVKGNGGIPMAVFIFWY